jgi:3-hydroxyacyl-CoA dehydrogenase/enoyl-CoA hydratase/3-hydroxybutyryl-CoA epimerase
MTSTTNILSNKSETATNPSVIVDIAANGIAVLTIDLPDAKVNTLGRRSMQELNDAIDKIAATQNVRGLVIASGKEDNFIAGADVAEIKKIQEQTQLEAYEASQMGKQVFAKIDKLPFPVVAAINGTCLGGGTELALACDFRIASNKAKIGLPEVMLGFVPGWGACVRLPKLLGVQKALELIMTGKVLDARKAWKIRLIDEVVDAAKLKERALEIAGGARPKRSSASLSEMAMTLALEKNPVGLNIIRSQAYKSMMRQTKGKYPAPKEALNLVIKSQKLPAEKAFEQESRAFSRLALTPVSRNLVDIFFAQTESKKLPANITEKPQLKTIGVLGAGVMGAGIAQACAKAGYKVIVKDVEDKFLEKGKATIKSLFDKIVERKRLTREEADKIIADMVFTTSYDQLADCDLVVEAVLEDLKIKRTALSELDRVIQKSYVFATNTSSLSVDKIAEGTSDPSKVVGLHFFNPVHKMPLVEIVRGASTSDYALAAAMTVALKLDKTTVITSDSPGFVVNRILAPYLREAAVLAEEGVPIADIDKAMKSFGMPMGPLVLLDEIGLDVAGKVIHVMHDALGERMAPPAFLSEIEKLKLLGKKGGKGIYLYDEKGKPDQVNPDVQACIKASPNIKTAGEIQDRLVLLMLNEAARCLEEKVVQEPGQLDLAMIFGTGFPPFLGGILKYADATGIDVVYSKLEFLARVWGERYAPCRLLTQLAKERQTFYTGKRERVCK